MPQLGGLKPALLLSLVAWNQVQARIVRGVGWQQPKTWYRRAGRLPHEYA
jgi:hypothetical protein